MPTCVMCEVYIPSKNAMCCTCWSNTLSSQKGMYIYVEKQKIDNKN